ncbi:hypothetical protein C8R44DRAFT_748994 [Mycena epipterygia]|nr:hypothetical protein C8R44DRAFT_748994 [Mycena epipterygia]
MTSHWDIPEVSDLCGQSTQFCLTLNRKMTVQDDKRVEFSTLIEMRAPGIEPATTVFGSAVMCPLENAMSRVIISAPRKHTLRRRWDVTNSDQCIIKQPTYDSRRMRKRKRSYINGPAQRMLLVTIEPQASEEEDIIKGRFGCGAIERNVPLNVKDPEDGPVPLAPCHELLCSSPMTSWAGQQSRGQSELQVFTKISVQNRDVIVMQSPSVHSPQQGPFAVADDGRLVQAGNTEMSDAEENGPIPPAPPATLGWGKCQEIVARR